MLKYLLLLSLILILINCSANLNSDFGYNNLEYVLVNSKDDASYYLISQGFKMRQNNTPYSNYPKHYYDFIRGKELSEITIEKRSYDVSCFLYSKNEFNRIIDSATSKGYKLDSIKNQLSDSSTFYHKGNIKISFSKVWSSGFKSKAMIQSYMIILTDIELDKKYKHRFEW